MWRARQPSRRGIAMRRSPPIWFWWAGWGCRAGGARGGGGRGGGRRADVAIAAAIASSYRDAPVAADLVLVGEVGLSGELRAGGQLQARLNEGGKLAFKRAVIPKTYRRADHLPDKIEVVTARSLGEALDIALARPNR